MLSLDEAIAKLRSNAIMDKYNMCGYSMKQHAQIAEWLEKLKYIEDIILRWNADWYNDEDNGIPDDEILEAIFNACTNNGFDVVIDEDNFKEGYNKAYEELESKYWEKLYQAEKNIRNKAIDDFVKSLQKLIEKDLSNPMLMLECKKCGIWKNYNIEHIAEQLKRGGTE